MKLDKDDFAYVLSTGRRFYAGALGVLGIDEDGDLFHGYDSMVTLPEEEALPPEERKGFTPEERKEIAAHFIERWQRWAAAPPERLTSTATHQVSGRGTIKVIDNPEGSRGWARFSALLGKRAIIDGEEWEVTGIEGIGTLVNIGLQVRRPKAP